VRTKPNEKDESQSEKKISLSIRRIWGSLMEREGKGIGCNGSSERGRFFGQKVCVSNGNPQRN
jgi:hypothetical protein